MIWKVLLWSLLGYISGSVLYAYLLPKRILHIDIRENTQDGNPGTANVFMRAGAFMGMLVLCAELLKGFVPVYLAKRFVDGSSLAFCWVMAAPVLGHIFPFFGRIRGGKGIAVSFGVLTGVLPESSIVWLLVILYIFFSVVICIRPHTYRSAVTFALFALGSAIIVQIPGIRLGAMLLAVLVMARHLWREPREALQLLLFGRYRLH